MSNEIWLKEEQKYLKAIEDVKIPNANLDNVSFVILKDTNDLIQIPSGGGCYWIWTNEPVLHSLHKNQPPKPFDNGEIIYNGIAKDDVKSRVKHHLFGDIDAGWSGISLDIYFGETTSHRKKALALKGKVPYVIENKISKRASKKKNLRKGEEYEIHRPIRKKEDFLKIYLTDEEKKILEEKILEEKYNGKIYFRNGINITDPKHSQFVFKVFFITGLSSLYLEFIEKKWRQFGLPKLCSYSSGR